jgi:formylglycine-generating enzyme required for sulfatase activity
MMSWTGSSFADIDPISGIDLVRIGATSNAAWPGNGNPLDPALGRGSVSYEYSIGRFEVTTPQWVEFFNAAYDRPAGDRIPHLIPPTFWGAVGTTPTTPGGQRWTVPAGNEMRPVGNISWRMAAIYCNWLHNGKNTEREAFMNGAYDVSTFTLGTGFNDQRTHNPDARYWISTWDEWLKSAHFDPDKNGPGQGGWWRYSNSSDTALVYGAPGTLVNGLPTEANSGWFDLANSQYRVLLGAYPHTQSPWGLLDVAGGTSEWTEEALGSLPNRLDWRIYEGSSWGLSLGGATGMDFVSGSGGDFPSLSTGDLGFRIASSVPSPSSIFLIGAGWGALAVRRRRR